MRKKRKEKSPSFSISHVILTTSEVIIVEFHALASEI